MYRLSRKLDSFPSICVARGQCPFLVCFALACVSSLSLAESSAFTRKSAETFTGKQTIEGAFRSLEIDYRNSRDALDLVGIDNDDLVVYWTWGADNDTVLPSIEFHLEAGQYIIIDAASGKLLTYLRYGKYWVSPGPAEDSAPSEKKTRDDALPGEKAAEIANAWIEKLAPGAAWHPQPPEYKDRFDVVPGDLFGAWWEFNYERVYEGYPARGADAEIGLNAETGELMRFTLPIFTPPASVDIYFPPENARIKADDYLNIAPNTLNDLLLYKPSLPEQQIQDTGNNFSVRGGLVGSRAQRKEAKKELKQLKKNSNNNKDGGEALEGPIPEPIPPALAPGDPTLALVAVDEVWKQQTWRPIDATKPTARQYTLVYEFATQTPTALTLPVLVTTNGNEIVR